MKYLNKTANGKRALWGAAIGAVPGALMGLSTSEYGDAFGSTLAGAIAGAALGGAVGGLDAGKKVVKAVKPKALLGKGPIITPAPKNTYRVKNMVVQPKGPGRPSTEIMLRQQRLNASERAIRNATDVPYVIVKTAGLSNAFKTMVKGVKKWRSTTPIASAIAKSDIALGARAVKAQQVSAKTTRYLPNGKLTTLMPTAEAKAVKKVEKIKKVKKLSKSKITGKRDSLIWQN